MTTTHVYHRATDTLFPRPRSLRAECQSRAHLWCEKMGETVVIAGHVYPALMCANCGQHGFQRGRLTYTWRT